MASRASTRGEGDQGGAPLPVRCRSRRAARSSSGCGSPIEATERPPLAEVDAVVAARRAEADEFYAAIHPREASADERRIQRQAWPDCSGASRAISSM